MAVPVESWDEYRACSARFEGPGLLPYAVATFFDQGGRRAYVVRIVHDDGTQRRADVRAASIGPAALDGRDGLRARNEGSWGNRLQASL